MAETAKKAITQLLHTCFVHMLLEAREHGAPLARGERRSAKRFTARFTDTSGTPLEAAMDVHVAKCADAASAFVLRKRREGTLWKALQANADGDYLPVDMDLNEATGEVTVSVTVTLIAHQQDAVSKRLVQRVFGGAAAAKPGPMPLKTTKKNK
jgi:hypothetical protein